MKKLLAGLFLLVSAALVTGCMLHARGHVMYDAPVVEYGYEPILYDGYVVYYADSGIPFIWLDGSQFWIPEARRTYYVSHYRQHRSAYHKWYSHRGEQYRHRRFAIRNGEQRSQHKANDRKRKKKSKHNSNKKHHKNHDE
jgi:hypothetical protein